jgi:His-Xaa-Ser system protein HxsD
MTQRQFTLDSRLATATAITAVAQRLGDRAGVAAIQEGEKWLLTIIPRPGFDIDAICADTLSQLADQMLRERLEQETRPVRALIMTQIFSASNLANPAHDGMAPGYGNA